MDTSKLQSPDPGRLSASGMKKGGSRAQKDFTKGLKQLYDSVVDEPMPQQFADLLAQLDSGIDAAGQAGAESASRRKADNAASGQDNAR